MRTRKEIEDRQRRLRTERALLPLKDRNLSDVVTSAYLAGGIHATRWMMQAPGSPDNSLPPELSDDDSKAVMGNPKDRQPVIRTKTKLTEAGPVEAPPSDRLPPDPVEPPPPPKIVGHIGERPVVDKLDITHKPEEGYDA